MPKTLKNKRGPSKKKGGKRNVSSKKRIQTKKNQKKNLVNKKKRKGGAVPDFVTEQERKDPDSDDDDVEPLSSANLKYLRDLNARIKQSKQSGEENKPLGSRPTYMNMAHE